MPVGPAIVGSLLGAGGAALGNLSSLLPSKYYRENRDNLEALQAREEAGNLGLSGVEQLRLLQSQAANRTAGQAAASNQIAAGLQGGNAAFGAAPVAAQAAALGNQALQAADNERIAEADRAAALRQQQEIEARLALQEQRRVEQLSAAGEIASGALEGAQSGASLGKMAGAKGAMNRESVQALVSAGVGQEQADKWAQTYTPEQLRALVSLYSDAG